MSTTVTFRSRSSDSTAMLKNTPKSRKSRLDFDLQQALKNCFGLKAADIRHLAKTIARGDYLGHEQWDRQTIPSFIKLIEQSGLYETHINHEVHVVEVADAIKGTIFWIRNQLEARNLDLSNVQHMEQLKMLAHVHLSRLGEDLVRRRQTKQMAVIEAKKQERLLDVCREVFDRSLR